MASEFPLALAPNSLGSVAAQTRPPVRPLLWRLERVRRDELQRSHHHTHPGGRISDHLSGASLPAERKSVAGARLRSRADAAE